ncbi:hypothetical protein BH20ACT9_BH20ACT9_06910 [soil metagenome]
MGEPQRSRLRLALLSAFILVAGLVSTVVVANARWAVARQSHEQLFARTVDQATARIDDNLTAAAANLDAARGLYAASEDVTRDEFRTLAVTLAAGEPLQSRFPGLQSLAVVRRGDDGRAVVRLIEPGGANEALLGRDVSSQLAPALEETSVIPDESLVTVAGLGRADLALLAPVARDPGLATSAPTMGEPPRLWVVALVDSRAAVGGALRGTRTMLRLTDASAGAEPSSLLVARDPAASAEGPAAGLRGTEQILVADRYLVLRYTALPGFAGLSGRSHYWLELTGGVVITLLLTWLVWTMGASKARALRLVAQATTALRDQEEHFRSLAVSSPVGIFYADTDGRVVYANRRLLQITQCDVDAVLGRGLWRLVHPAEREQVAGDVARLRDGGPRGWAGSVEDITRQVVTQQALAARESEHRQLAQRFEHQALHDPLTGMPNRALLGRRLSEALAAAGGAPGTVGVLFCDLDGFKVVNDSLGHTAGDRLLVSVARRFAQHVRGTDLAARLGGDEFAVLVPQVSDPGALEALARRLLDGLAEPFVVDRRSLAVTASVGIATNAEGGGQPGDLLRDADLAMYAAKRRGPGELAWFHASMHNSAVARLELESDLRTALVQHQLVVHYQPIVDLASGRLVGAEALAGWRHPQRGLLVAADFVPVAQETGLIGELGRQVLQRACRHARALPDPVGERLTMSVNVSIRQLTQRDFAADAREALEQGGLRASRLVVELTESDLMNCPVEVLNVLEALRALGVRVAIDDFGTGYSSLGQLGRLPIDILKIDRSFVCDLDAGDQLAYVEAVVRLGHTLGLRVLAEGVETAGQRDQLLGVGCDQGQGSFFGPPMEPAVHRRLVETAAPAVGRVG